MIFGVVHITVFVLFCFIGPTPERNKSPDPGRDSISPVPDMDGKRLRLSLHSPIFSPVNKPIVPVRVSNTNCCHTKNNRLQIFKGCFVRKVHMLLWYQFLLSLRDISRRWRQYILRLSVCPYDYNHNIYCHIFCHKSQHGIINILTASGENLIISTAT